MKFKINNIEYKIKEVSQDKFFKSKEEKENETLFFHGQTKYETFEVLLYKNLPDCQKRQTLMHELMHIYLKSFITYETLENINEEVLCDISANSHDIIHKIVEDYFN